MFLNVCKVKHDNKIYAYLRIIESYCHKGKIKKRLIANLGQLALINKESLYRLGTSLIKYAGRKTPVLEELEAISALRYGEIIAIKAIWNSLRLQTILKSALHLRKRIKLNYPLCVFIMLVNRLIAPKSKLAITKWQKRIYIESPSKPHYQRYLRALDYLAKSKERIESHSLATLLTCFSGSTLSSMTLPLPTLKVKPALYLSLAIPEIGGLTKNR